MRCSIYPAVTEDTWKSIDLISFKKKINNATIVVTHLTSMDVWKKMQATIEIV